MFEFDKSIKLAPAEEDVLAVGELLIDMISTEYDDSFTCDTYKRHFGGSPSNIAMNCKRLGIRSSVAAAVGKDGLGQWLLHKLEHSGMSTACVQRSNAATSMVMLTKSRSTPTPIFYRDADFQLQFDEKLKEAVQHAKIIHFSCWPISRRPARDTLLQVIALASQQGKLVCFDPNYHPAIWEKGEDGLTIVKELLSKADIIKPSEDDAKRLFGPDTAEHQMDKFLKLGARLVIMTLGKDGAIVSNGQETLRIPSLAQQVVDTTGAGDAFWSGFYAGIAKELTVRDAIQAGMAVSAYKLRFTGAVAELPTLDVIRKEYQV